MKRKISPLYLMSIFIAVNRLLSFKVILLFSSCDKSILLLKINPVDDKLLSTSCAIHLFFSLSGFVHSAKVRGMR